MFALHVLHGMYPDMFMVNEWEFFIGMLVDGGSDQNDITGSAPGWIEEERRTDVAKLIKAFTQLATSIQIDG